MTMQQTRKNSALLLTCIFALCLGVLLMSMRVSYGASPHVPGAHMRSSRGRVSGLEFDSITIEDAETHEKIADLLAGETPKLRKGITYALNVGYKVPSALQFKATYLQVWLGNGIYVTGLPGATFTEGAIDNTSFEQLVHMPTGTGTSPYGYPNAGSERARNGSLIYRTKNGLTRVDTRSEIHFRVDDAYVNEDAKQVINGAIKLALDTKPEVAAYTQDFAINPCDELRYSLYTAQPTEVVSKGNTTTTLHIDSAGSGASLTEANSKTSIQIVYPKDLELVGLEETALYKKNGTVVKTEIEGDNKVSTVEWNELGSYSGGCAFKPHIKVPADSPRENGSSFFVALKNFKKTIWNDTPNADRTSGKQIATVKVTIIDGKTPEKIRAHTLVDTAMNWSLKKYDTYNVRLGAYLIKNELSVPTKPKTLEMQIDQTNTAIIRGVTIPYEKSMQYGPIHWSSASGKSGTADPSILKKSSKVSALITNTALGLNINDSITSIKVDLGPLPAKYDGIAPQADLLETYDANNKYIYDEFYGWSYISNGVYGCWKKGTEAPVKTTIKFYTTGTTPTAEDTVVTTAKSKAPAIRNGVGSIDKQQINGGSSFKITGRINDENWDWNPLQEPVLYLFMPEGFSYSDLKVTNATLGKPTLVGEFTCKDNTNIKVWRYDLNVGEQTRGQYQPDFSAKSMELSMTVNTNKLAKKGIYHINDFVGFTTKDFKAVDATIKKEKWDGPYWKTSKDYADLFGDKVNAGKPMVSLAEGKGITINQAAEITAMSTFSVTDGFTKATKTLSYDPNNKQATTAVMQKGDTATVRMTVRNNAKVAANVTKLFIPLLNSAKNFGPSFSPENAQDLLFEVVKATPSANFEVKYIKLNDGVSYDTNHAPKPNEYQEVSDIKQADMIMCVAARALAMDEGGYVDISYRVAGDVDSSYNNKRRVFSTVLFYDIEGNQKQLTLQTNAMTVASSDVVLTKVWNDNNNEEQLRPNTAAFVQKLTLSADKAIDPTLFVPQVTDLQNGTYKVIYKGLPKYAGTPDQLITYTLTEGAIDKYTADKTSFSGTTKADVIAGTITNTHAKPTPPPAPWTPLEPPFRSVKVTKTWHNHAGEKIAGPVASVDVELYKNGVATGTRLTLNAANNWAGEFKSLPVYESAQNPTSFEYSVKEVGEDKAQVTLAGTVFEVSYTGDMATGFIITNKEKPKSPVLPTPPAPTLPPTPASVKKEKVLPRTSDATISFAAALPGLVGFVLAGSGWKWYLSKKKFEPV